MLIHIRKPNTNIGDGASKDEVEQLRGEVTTLKRKLSEMSEDMDALKKLVRGMIQEQQWWFNWCRGFGDVGEEPDEVIVNLITYTI